ncbi:uncharacterized protein LOC132948166 isoform X1 [Metopolophium dirhodum]|uniref:uncharacterized protein LOC132948166 isoform X1 n=1 Tax=Metopolophium dirhodum TaxID=44670 RepID=UPI0029907B2B|nr:uncharacterized protein LOC132948166 isoform X1 [Metopolophium dirhodum]XP_060874503.1 uncharacterized protein LOC132948166 isoform X1 [Metopolophium dirhodum]
MDKLGVEEVAINLELMKRSRFYHILNPNGTKIFNCNAYRLFLFLYGSIVNCIVVFSTLGFFVEMDDTLSFTDLFVAIFVLINFFLCYWRICVFMYNVNAIHEVLSVSRFDLLKSKHCCKHVNVLNDYRDRTIKITNYFFLFSSTVMSQWFIYPLVVIAFTRPEDENGRFQNIMNLRYPVSTYTYNHYYFIFYLMEVVVAIFTMYAMIIPDILLMCVCWAIIAQQKVLTRAFKNIGHEDNSQMVYYEDFKLILLDQLQLNLKIKLFYSVVRPIILTYVAIISTCFIIVTYVLLLVCMSKESHPVLTIIKLGSSALYMVLHLYLYCYLFDSMNIKRQSVNTGIYSCDWTKMDIQFKKLLLLTMQMNNANNLEIKASPKKIVNLQLFANIITMSYNIVSVMLETTS